MSTLMDYYIGRNGRVIVFALRRGNKYYNLLSVIEAFPDGMALDTEFTPDSKKEYVDIIKNVDSKTDKVFFGVENIVITQELLKNPQSCLSLGKSKIHNLEDDFKTETTNWIDLPNSDIEITNILPKRKTSCRISCFSPNSIIKSLGNEKQQDRIYNQLRLLSERNLNIDLTQYKAYLGSYIIMLYTPIYRNLDVRRTLDNSVICRINYRTANHPLLKIEMTAIDSEGKAVYPDKETTIGTFLKGFKFPCPVRGVQLQIKDENGELIDEHWNMRFLQSIELNCGMKTTDVHYILTEEDEQGNETLRKEKTVEKYSYEKSIISLDNNEHVINRRPATRKTDSIHSLFDSSPEYTYKKFEDSLDFVFFDGDKGRIQENQARAKECVMRILNSAEKICYICDIFFNDNTFFEFLTEIKSLSPDIRILSSKENLKHKNIKALTDFIKQSNEKLGHKIECRLMKGDKAALHDRILIADDKVWMLGCSLNEFGIRATSLIRVPNEYAPKIIQGVTQWWEDDTQTESINK